MFFKWVETTNQKITKKKVPCFEALGPTTNSENQKMAPENQFGEIFPFWNFGPLKGGTCWIFLRVFLEKENVELKHVGTHHL